MTALTWPRLGLGLAPLGKENDASPIAAIDAAWRLGMRFFDTAPLYGGGRSERRAGQALRGRPRTEYVIATKVGHYVNPDGTRVVDHDFIRAQQSFRESLTRLGIERVDLLYVHDPDGQQSEAITGSFRACQALRAAGEVTAIGVSVNSARVGVDFLSAVDVDVIMIASRYSLLDQSALNELLPLCADRGTAVVIAGVFNSGLLVDAAADALYDYRPAPGEKIARAQAIKTICARYEVPLAAAAIQFAMSHPAVTSVVVGATRAAEVEQNAAWADWQIPPALWDELKTSDLIPATAPVAGETT